LDSAQPPALSLRPLTIGELLDRAVTLFVRNVWLFCGLAAVVYVPLGLVQSLMGDFWLWYANTLGTIFTTRGKLPALPGDASMIQRMNAVSSLELIVWIVGAPLVAGALAHAAGKLTVGEAASFRESLRFGARRWGSVLVYLLLWVILAGAAFLAGYLGLLLMALIVAAVLRSIPLAIILGMLILAAWIVALLLAFVAGGVGFATLIVEPLNIGRAFAAGLERSINRTTAWRSILIGLLFGAISLGFTLVAYAAGFGLLFALHTGIPMILISAVVSVVEFGFSVLIVVLYYYDLRVRREGVDLVSLASQVAASP
jgi:hypothetical protein